MYSMRTDKLSRLGGGWYGFFSPGLSSTLVQWRGEEQFDDYCKEHAASSHGCC